MPSDRIYSWGKLERDPALRYSPQQEEFKKWMMYCYIARLEKYSIHF
jgi:hypothetical protein